MVKKSKNLEKSQKFTFKFTARKKINALSFPILGGRDSTIAIQSTPFQNPGGVL